MDDILVATVARPQSLDSDERLGERQQQDANSEPTRARRTPLESSKRLEIVFSLTVHRWGETCLPGSSQL